MKRAIAILSALALLHGSVGKAKGAPILWNSPQTISGDTDVKTDGTLVGAFGVGSPGLAATTVNGVTFAPFPLTGTSDTSGNFQFSDPSGFSSANGFSSVNGPFSTLSSSYQKLLSNFAGNGAPFTLTMSRLTVGDTYEFEWWSNTTATSNVVTTATATNAVSLESNTTNTNGGVGQFGVGVFVADSSSEVITFNGPFEPLLDGFQLRNETPAATPEPASLTLLGTALAFGGFHLRRRRKAA